jgi:hypothetical protein
VEFHVHTGASLLAVGAMLSQNATRKSDHSVCFKAFEQNKTNCTIERKALIMVFASDKFKHYLLGNKLVFYVDHMALVYLVNKP